MLEDQMFQEEPLPNRAQHRVFPIAKIALLPKGMLL